MYSLASEMNQGIHKNDLAFWKSVKAQADKVIDEATPSPWRPARWHGSKEELLNLMRDVWLSGPDAVDGCGYANAYKSLGQEVTPFMTGNGPEGTVNANMISLAVNLFEPLLDFVDSVARNEDSVGNAMAYLCCRIEVLAPTLCPQDVDEEAPPDSEV